MNHPNVPVIEVADKRIGPNEPTFIIAEAGVNHNGDLAIAEKLIDAAAEAGADAVKFQTFRAESVMTANAEKAPYQVASGEVGESQLEMVKKLELSPSDHEKLRDRCLQRKIVFLSTPFDLESLDLLDRLGLPLFKIGSGDITYGDFIANVARRNKPIVLSTGMSRLSEVEGALEVIEKTGNVRPVLLHCVSNYPASPPDVNLRAIPTLAQAFGTAVGYSDHTRGSEIAIAAVALGACVIEKHFTLDGNMPGPDHRASLDPTEFRSMVDAIRNVESALGDGIKRPSPSELQTMRAARRSLVSACEIPERTSITQEMICVKRPGHGIPPRMLACVAGRIAKVRIPADSLIQWDQLL